MVAFAYLGMVGASWGTCLRDRIEVLWTVCVNAALIWRFESGKKGGTYVAHPKSRDLTWMIGMGGNRSIGFIGLKLISLLEE